MDSQAKRTLLATLLCMLVVFGWIEIQRRIYPPVPPAQTSDTTATQPAGAAPVTTSGPSTTQVAANSAIEAQITAAPPGAAEPPEPVEIGDDHQDRPKAGVENPYKLKLFLDPRGASVRQLTLADHRQHVAKDPKNPDHDPYVLLRTVEAPDGEELRSFVTDSITISGTTVDLANSIWSPGDIEESKGNQTATFKQELSSDGKPLVEVRKTYRVEPDTYLIKLSYEIENKSDRPQEIVLTEYGPIGIERSDIRYDHPRAMISIVDEKGRKSVGESVLRRDVLKEKDARRRLLPGDDHILWSAVSNKYFTCIIDPHPRGKTGQQAPEYAAYLDDVSAVARVGGDAAENDLSLRMVYSPKAAVAPGSTLQLAFDVYCGPKNTEVFEKVAPTRRYDLTRAADSSMCTFELVTRFMTALLGWLYAVVRNWGVAIIILVIIVRLVLHPITRTGQINMMKMQKNMAKIKPKLEAIQQQYRNDRQKLNEETMKLYKTEGVNPAGSIFGCLPMVLQMPIWVALYTALNTNVVLRHAPFFGYIRDLSAPDTLIDFGRSYTIPLIGAMMGPIQALNLLPILMAGIMYGQQKVMQRLTKPDKPPEPKLDSEGRPVPDQMAQQQKIMNFMMIFMGLLFYNMPSGLCLYILCSSLLGMGEQIYIRKHLKEKDLNGNDSKPKGPKKPGLLMRKFEEMQKAVEQARAAQERSPRSRGGRRR